VPDDFRFAFKVTDEITIRRYPNLPRFGPRAGQDNTQFLDAELFTRAFLGPMESIRPKVGPLIFEFSHFQSTEYKNRREFIDALDGFLSQNTGTGSRAANGSLEILAIGVLFATPAAWFYLSVWKTG
jgi:uncharacterized protein YecE (DUF72 family)